MNAFGPNIGGIYQIKNIINNNRYVGSSAHLAARFRKHKNDLEAQRHHSRHLQNAWNKYGKDNFVFQILLLCPENDLLKYEQAYLNNGHCEYNIAVCAETSGRGIKRSKETCTKISKALTGKSLSQEHRKKIGNAKLGNTYRLGSKASDETKEKLRTSHLGHVPSAETLLRMSETHRAIKINTGRFGQGNPGHLGYKGGAPWNKGMTGVSEETSKKMSNSAISRSISEETRTKMRAGITAYWESKKQPEDL